MSQIPGSQVPSRGSLPRVQPISAFGIFFCCVGYVWTVISYVQVCTGINQMEPTANLQWWTLFIPIYGNLYFSTVIQALNKTAQQRQAPLQPLADNIALHLLVPIVSLFQIFTRYNELVNIVEGPPAA